MSKFHVKVRRYVEKVAEIEINARDEHEARRLAFDYEADDGLAFVWDDGADLTEIEIVSAVKLDH
ncbi:hypothetical protein [Mesorhizobium sp. M7A.F.Ca.MR.362.00.0.0]|uniref:hypothetical protein n=1 Tax=Mesorhizobium sp. M7A.F.Ca.MR.362.00.0.0 TaxID=2496779 RepID=UPI000FD3B635|nr:hypothetical protein [Mesorhizobium sp. M7A.F.Ca.MR.362.00.0.0]RUU74948.1 hypothetical protein EOC06_32120 [Mesorhizobium sp. M7A.F.Ca.MR.362.00.0.0]RWN95439.1 MAG: hypothetical protein EOS05_11640 [Mesorhizobium sp.]